MVPVQGECGFNSFVMLGKNRLHANPTESQLT